jgi:UDP-N-acetylglucosamine/UDP-N-acetylgalactosamine diphosphorylase
VPYLDIETGTLIEPREPNAVKLETFVFDALPLCDRTIVYETDRVEEFAPIKNADAPGAVDTRSTSVRTQTERAARWLEANGVKVARTADGSVDAVIEISHLAAIEAQDLKTQNIPAQIDRGTEVLL